MKLITKEATHLKYLLFFVNGRTIKGIINALVLLGDVLLDEIVYNMF